MPRANMRDVFEFEVAFPSLPEQQRIVDILDREFAKIDALKANAEKSLQAAKDLFQATLKKELLYRIPTYRMTMEEVKSAVFRYVFTYYNQVRVYTRNPNGWPPAVYRRLQEKQIIQAA